MTISSALVKSVTAAALLGLALFAPSGAHAQGGLPPHPSTQWVMGYYVGYEESLLPPAKIDWSGLTHIVMGRVKANADGTLNTDFDIDTVNGPKLAKQVSAAAHTAGKKAILMLGGSDNSPLVAQAVANHMTAFVQNLVSAMNTYGYDGLDLDWENTIDWAQFQAFATALRKAAPTAILTMPVNVINLNYETVDPHMGAIAAQIDRVDLMSYNPGTSYAGEGWYSWFGSPLKGEKANTPVSIDTSMEQFLNAGVPRQKLGLGIGFYAICYTGGITAPNQSTGNGTKITIQGGDGEFMLSELYGATNEYHQIYRRWFKPAAEPYLTLPTAERHGCRYLSYEDEESIAAKGLFSRMHNYGGIIIWTINQGYVASHPNPNFLMDALYKGFVDPSLTTPVAISILQAKPQVTAHHGVRLSALVTGTTNKDVVWSVTTTACGTVSKSGFYIAAKAKSCTLKATSIADPTKTASVAVTVAAAQ